LNAGDKVTFTVIHDKGDTPKQIVVTLEPRPMEPQEAKRFYARDLGFVAAM